LIIEAVEKKLREARFFLDKMIEHEQKAFNDKEPFDYYLSAFLNAGRTVGNRLRHEHKAMHQRCRKHWREAIYLRWRDDWEATLTQPQRDLITFMINDRDVEVHEAGSTSRVVKIENGKLGPGDHTFAGGTMYVAGPSDIFPLATIPAPAYYFTIDGAERKATEACGEYLGLLRQMVAKFKADHA
jgi:hypothetical protein